MRKGSAVGEGKVAVGFVGVGGTVDRSLCAARTLTCYRIGAPAGRFPLMDDEYEYEDEPWHSSRRRINYVNQEVGDAGRDRRLSLRSSTFADDFQRDPDALQPRMRGRTNDSQDMAGLMIDMNISGRERGGVRGSSGYMDDYPRDSESTIRRSYDSQDMVRGDGSQAVPSRSGEGKGLEPSSGPVTRRRDWIELELQKRKSEFMVKKRLKVFAGTWNVNGRKPSTDVSGWLFQTDSGVSKKASMKKFDVYLIGIQETQSLSGMNAVATDAEKGKCGRSI